MIAAKALVEGDAMLAAFVWAGQHLSREEVSALLSNGLGGDASDDAGEALLEQPQVYRTQATFLYGNGMAFALQAYLRSGGFEGVDALFAALPESSEQVLHPDKYFAHEHPIEVALPDLAAALGNGWARLDTDTVGEIDVKTLLQERGDEAAAEQAASGWGGGRYQLLERDGRPAVAIKTTWDSDLDAREFFDVYAHALRLQFPDAAQTVGTPARQALTGAGAATELRIVGRDVLAVIAFDRSSAEAIASAAGGF
jgi:hypothetical protein